MLKEGSFEVNYLEMNASEVGDADGAAGHSFNYYADNNFRGTMCCNCDKVAAQLEQ